MTRIVTWFLLSCKRYGKRISFLLILLLLPFGMAVLGAMEKDKPQEIRIAVYVQEGQEEELGGQLAKSLSRRNSEDGMFHFYLCENEQQLRDDVVSRRAECGYVVERDLESKLDHKDCKRCITVYSAPSTVTAKLSTEVVFSVMMELYDRNLLVDYVEKGELFETVGEPGSAERIKAAEKAGDLYDSWIDSGKTFHFEYASPDSQGNAVADSPLSPAAVFPVRGLVAVCIFIVGLYGAVTTGIDEQKGLFLPLPYRFRIPCRIACIAGPVCMAALSGLLAIQVGGSGQEALKELAAMGSYVALIIAFSSLLGAVCRKPQILCCLIPFFIIGSLIFCPVIVDAGRFLPAFRPIGRLFLPYYYLALF